MIYSVENYNQNRGIFSPLVEHNGIACGYWLCGNNYRNDSDYYGTYPPSYLARMKLLFPGAKDVLHLFSGMVKKGRFENEITMDINGDLKPDVTGNASEIRKYFGEGTFDLILADPPYNKNYIRYNTGPVNKKKVVHESAGILKVGGFMVWLDTIIPIWAKSDGWKLRGTIAVVQSTNHQIRGITILEKTRDTHAKTSRETMGDGI